MRSVRSNRYTDRVLGYSVLQDSVLAAENTLCIAFNKQLQLFLSGSEFTWHLQTDRNGTILKSIQFSCDVNEQELGKKKDLKQLV